MQVSGDAGGQLPGLPQQNGGSMPSEVSNIGALRRSWHADSDLQAARQCILESIIQLFQWRLRSSKLQHLIPETARFMEDGLFREAVSKEDYMDLNTLDVRLKAFAKRSLRPGFRERKLVIQGTSSTGTVGTMIPTPGMSNTGNANSMVAATVGDVSMMSAPPNTIAPDPAGIEAMLQALRL